MSAGTIVHAPDGTEVVLGEVGQRILLANPRVRVWEVDLAPGQTQPWHLHHNPYVVLCLDTSKCRMDWLDGSPPRFISETVGGAVYRPVSPVHMLTNYGDSRYRNRLIELLDLGEEASGRPEAPPPGTATASTEPADLPPLTEVLTTDEVRIRRLTVVPGTELTWSAGLVPAVLVALAGGPDGETAPTAGVHYLGPGESHLIRNPGGAAFDVQIVELCYLAVGPGDRSGSASPDPAN